jgi:hypothetical protein
MLARKGIDKLTIVASPGIRDLGAWLEQLIAESTGKEGKGIIPVDGERLAAPDAYGNDRLFAYLRLEEAPDTGQDAAVEALERPASRSSDQVATKYDLAEGVRPVGDRHAIAGSLIGINPSTSRTSKRARSRPCTDERVREERPAAFGGAVLRSDGVKLFADARNEDEIRRPRTTSARSPRT